METTKVYQQIESELMFYKKALARGSGHIASRERVKNLLFSNADALLECARNTSNLEERLKAIKQTLAEADSEYDLLNKENKKLKTKLKEAEDDIAALQHEVNELRMSLEQEENE